MRSALIAAGVCAQQLAPDGCPVGRGRVLEAVIAYWFPPSITGISGLKAYDKAGRALSTGNAGIGAG